MQRLPADIRHFADRHGGEFRGVGIVEHIRAGGLQLQDLRVDRRVRHLIRQRLDHHLVELIAQAVLQAVDVVAAQIVVLIQDADLRVGLMRQDVFGIHLSLQPVARLKRDAPGVVLGIGDEHRRAGAQPDIGHFLLVDIFADRGIRRSTDGLEQDGDLFILDQLADDLDRFRRAVAVIQGNQVDLAAVDAALFIDHLEISRLGGGYLPIHAGGAAERSALTDLDLGIGNTDQRLLCGGRLQR